MNAPSSKRRRTQAGFTLIELMVATAIGLIVMTGLTSVVFTTYQANQIAISRVQAASVIGIFQATAHDDFALSGLPQTPGGCGSSAQPCTQEPIALAVATCTMTGSGTVSTYHVTYNWNSATHEIDRTVAGLPLRPAASGVSSFSWFVSGGTPPSQSVVLTLTVTIGTYSQSQTMSFYPRVVSVPAYVGVPAC